jgi:hypothetical protein
LEKPLKHAKVQKMLFFDHPKTAVFLPKRSMPRNAPYMGRCVEAP